MKAIIENSLTTTDSDHSRMTCSEVSFLFYEFNHILQSITMARNENELRKHMKSINYEYFTYGFGSSHMWVNQIDKDIRIIFVEFN